MCIVFVVVMGASKLALANVSTFQDRNCNATLIGAALSCVGSVSRLHVITGAFLFGSIVGNYRKI